MGERMPPDEFWATLAWLVERRQIAIEFRNYRLGEYTRHTFVANATSWAATGGPITITYDQDVADEEWRKSREEEREAGGDG